MRIGVDSRPLREPRTSGIPMSVRSLLHALAEIDHENEYVLYAHKDFKFDFPNERWRKRSGALTRYGTVWMQAELPFWLIQDKIDVFWGTQHILPLQLSKKIKSILTVYDLVHYVFPETMRFMNLTINKLLIPPSIRKADAVVSVSHWTMEDIRKYLQPSAPVMEVVHLGLSPNFFPRNHQHSKEKVCKAFNIPDPFLLTVGTFEPRKNIIGTIRAFSMLADRIPHHLAIVGQEGWKNEGTMEEIRKSPISKRIHLLGYVPDNFLADVYSAADLFVFPSLYEGFGLPPLEAMACAVPVVSSNVSSIPEVVGDAALLVNPNDPKEIADGILTILNNSNLRRDYISRGLLQSSKFNWKNTAEQMLNIFKKTLASRHSREDGNPVFKHSPKAGSKPGFPPSRE